MKLDLTMEKAPVRAGTVVLVLACDWLVYAVNLLSSMRALLPVTVIGAAICALATLRAERSRAAASWYVAGGKGLVAGLIVAAPLPVLSTVFAIVVLAWAIIAGVVGRPEGASRV